jgi:hypothetical protein|uniref:Uncharacterized protein n=1 Tax=Siphoviridae sp. ctHEr2 TaxID=2826229 RepID=A0A8S5NFW1_9CAUD|nr:MAG TPA: hypothetical protein [Siphoviridae sp. ctHEr2]
MNRRLIRAGVVTSAPEGVIKRFMREYGFDHMELPKVSPTEAAFYSVTYDELKVQVLDECIRMIDKYLPDRKRGDIALETDRWSYRLSQLHEDPA